MNVILVSSTIVLVLLTARVWVLMNRSAHDRRLEAATQVPIAALPAVLPAAGALVDELPRIDLRQWIETHQLPPPPIVDLGAMGVEQENHVNDDAIWRGVAKTLAMRGEKTDGQKQS